MPRGCVKYVGNQGLTCATFTLAAFLLFGVAYPIRKIFPLTVVSVTFPVSNPNPRVPPRPITESPSAAGRVATALAWLNRVSGISSIPHDPYGRFHHTAGLLGQRCLRPITRNWAVNVPPRKSTVPRRRQTACFPLKSGAGGQGLITPLTTTT